MSEHPNAAKVRQAYDAFAKGDLEAVKARLTDDVVWHIGGNTVISGDYKGADEVMGFFGRLMQETGGSFKVELEHLVADDSYSMALVHVSGERNGKRLNQPNAHVARLVDGKIADFSGFAFDAEELLAFWS